MSRYIQPALIRDVWKPHKRSDPSEARRFERIDGHGMRFSELFHFGRVTMLGVGWLVVMDDWLIRGGPLGGILGFAIGGALLLPIGYVYGKLVMAMPDAAAEVAYTAKVFPRYVSFLTGWMMVLAYFIVCPWEAVAVGTIAGYIFPALDSMELYRIGGRPVYLPAFNHRPGPHRAAHRPQLPRRPPERHLPKLDCIRHHPAFSSYSSQLEPAKVLSTIFRPCSPIRPGSRYCWCYRSFRTS